MAYHSMTRIYSQSDWLLRVKRKSRATTIVDTTLQVRVTSYRRVGLSLKQCWISKLSVRREEPKRLLLTMLDAIYIDTRNKLVVAVKPKPPFRPIFQVAASCKGSDICIIHEPLKGSAVFLVETGESRTPRPKEAVQNVLQA